MSSPAIRALKETFDCSISLLTSSMAKGITTSIPEIDECIVWDAPWVKGTEGADLNELNAICKTIQNKEFDAAVIFTVFSQNPLPTAMLPTLAGIPRRLAYCRENPYHLLTHWVPEEEPYSYIEHQVRRDLNLVRCVGANTTDESIRISEPQREADVKDKLSSAGVDLQKPWLILHPGVSEKKREYPIMSWIEAGKKIVQELDYQLIITGVEKERTLAEEISTSIGPMAYNVAGKFTLDELINVIRLSPLLISVNTGTIHIASAVHTKVVVLYALTNPQHAPWKSIGKVLPYSIPEGMQSRNEVLRYVQRTYFGEEQRIVSPHDILTACYDLLIAEKEPLIPELIMPSHTGNSYGIRNVLNLTDP